MHRNGVMVHGKHLPRAAVFSVFHLLGIFQVKKRIQSKELMSMWNYNKSENCNKGNLYQNLNY